MGQSASSNNATPLFKNVANVRTSDPSTTTALSSTSASSQATAMTEESFLGSGWSFPPTFDKSTNQVVLSGSETNINQSIDLVLQTPRGARSLIPDFGSNLSSFLFRNADATLKDELEQSVKTTLLENEPRITVDSVVVTFVRDNGSTVNLAIYYTVKNTNTRHNHVFPFSLLEGTNLQVTT